MQLHERSKKLVLFSHPSTRAETCGKMRRTERNERKLVVKKRKREEREKERRINTRRNLKRVSRGANKGGKIGWLTVALVAAINIII